MLLLGSCIFTKIPALLAARLRLYSNTPTASLLHMKHRIILVASCHIGLDYAMTRIGA